MILIRPEQMAVFRTAKLVQYATELAPQLRHSYAEELEALDDAALVALTREALERAAAYGFESEAHLRRFAALEILAGAPLGSRRDVDAILSARDLTPRRKLQVAAELLGIET